MASSKTEKYLLAGHLPDVVKLHKEKDIGMHIKIDRNGKLGEGCFGTVYRCKDLELQEPRAVKVIDKMEGFEPHLDIDSCLSYLFIEAVCVTTILPPQQNIVRVYQYYETPTYIYIVMELLRKLNMAHVMKGYDCNQSRKLFHKILRAVKHIHDHGLVHSDLKLDNICLRKKTLTEPVLIDLGQIAFQDDEKAIRPFQGCNIFSKIHFKDMGLIDNDLTKLGDILESFLTGQEDTRDMEGERYPPKGGTHPEALDLLDVLTNNSMGERLTIETS